MARIRRWLALLAAVLVAATLLAGCAPTPSLSIGAVVRNAGALNGTTVVVSGRVRTGGSIFGVGAYQLDDGTGRIWVATRSGAPRPRRTATVVGIVRRMLKVGNLQVLTLSEVSRS